VQIAIVGAGVGAILTASATAFYAIKWFGVAYLVYLAIKQWRALPMDMSDDAAVRPIGKPLALVFRGFLVNISNPKALVFMLAVLPQFIDPRAAADAVPDHRRDHDLRRPDRHGRLHGLASRCCACCARRSSRNA
jgi:threonine/homoserine/homoserine lactone efflux protein